MKPNIFEADKVENVLKETLKFIKNLKKSEIDNELIVSIFVKILCDFGYEIYGEEKTEEEIIGLMRSYCQFYSCMRCCEERVVNGENMVKNET